MENKYRVTLDVQVSFDIMHGEVNLEFGDEQSGAVYELYAESGREAIAKAQQQYLDEMTQFMGKDFADFVYHEFISEWVEEIEEDVLS